MPDQQSELPLNFHFSVEFVNSDYRTDHQFRSVEGLHAQLEVGETTGLKEVRFDELVLKRAYRPDSKLLEWCMNFLKIKGIEPENRSIK